MLRLPPGMTEEDVCFEEYILFAPKRPKLANGESPRYAYMHAKWLERKERQK